MRTPLLAIAASVMLCGVAQADTLVVCPKGCTYSSIQDAIVASSDGDEILVGPGTYTSTHPAHAVDMKGKAITLRSTDGPDVTIIDGENARRGIACYQGETKATVIEGFTITNGYAVEYDYDGDGWISSEERSGGGMFNYWIGPGTGNPTLTNCIFENNTASEEYEEGGVAGGMYNSWGSPTLTNCTFTANSSFWAGAMYNRGVLSNPTLTNCIFTGNSAIASSGAMYNEGSPTLTNCTFENNTAGGIGGGMYNSDSNATLENCNFTNNHAGNGGGGMGNGWGSSPTLTNCTFENNTVWNDGGYGGGMYNNFENNPTLENCTFKGNSASSGGAISANNSSNPTVTSCTFKNNTAGEVGGGIYVSPYSDSNIAIVLDSLFCENTPGDFYGTWEDLGWNLFWTTCNDCNENGIDDQQDIADGTVTDVDQDGIPDECEYDCDGDGTPDPIELYLGDATDSNGDGLPDECQCLSDFTEDGVVDVIDLLAVLAAWGSTGPLGDVNEDGTVDVNDLLLVISAWGPCP